MQLRAEQIQQSTINNLQIAVNAAIAQSKIANQVADPTGWISKGTVTVVNGFGTPHSGYQEFGLSIDDGTGDSGLAINKVYHFKINGTEYSINTTGQSAPISYNTVISLMDAEVTGDDLTVARVSDGGNPVELFDIRVTSDNTGFEANVVFDKYCTRHRLHDYLTNFSNFEVPVSGGGVTWSASYAGRLFYDSVNDELRIATKIDPYWQTIPVDNSWDGDLTVKIGENAVSWPTPPHQYTSNIPFELDGTNLFVYYNGFYLRKGDNADYTIIDTSTIQLDASYNTGMSADDRITMLIYKSAPLSQYATKNWVLNELTTPSSIIMTLDDSYDDGSEVTVDDTDVNWKLSNTKNFKITESNGTTEIISVSAASGEDSVTILSVPFSQTDAGTISSNFAFDSQIDFDWTVRATEEAAITSIMGAINANRDDLFEYVELVRTQGAALGVAAGANLIGVDGIAGITPTGKTAGDASNLQAMLEGIAFPSHTHLSSEITDATSVNTASMIVKRDGSGDFAANTITIAGDIVPSSAATSNIGSIDVFINNAYIHNILFQPLAETNDYAGIKIEVSGNNTLIHHQIGRDAGDQIIFEANNGSTVTGLLTVSGDGTVSIPGNLVVSGTTTTVNSTTTQMADASLVIKYAVTGLDGDSSLDVRRAKTSVEGDRDAKLRWNDTSHRWEAVYGTSGELTSNITVAADIVASGSTVVGAVSYNGTTKASGKFDGGSTAPSNTTRLNYDGNLYANNIITTINSGIGYAPTGDGMLTIGGGTCAYNMTSVANTSNAVTWRAVNSAFNAEWGGVNIVAGYSRLYSATGGVKLNGAVQTAGAFDDTANAPTDTTRLNYNGYFYATRVYNAVWNDLAEFMDKNSVDKSMAGDVLIQTKNGLVKSYKRGDKAAVGVYSDTFGYALGANDTENKYPVGLAGVVLVKVGEPLEIGDLLISGVNGFAVKATEEEEMKRGIVLGKALEQKNDSAVSRIRMLILSV